MLCEKLNKLVLQYSSSSSVKTINQDENCEAQVLVKPKLKEREILIGLFLLQGKTHGQIADYLGISSSRLNQILRRICRFKFGVNGSGARYCQLFMAGEYYNQISPKMLLQLEQSAS